MLSEELFITKYDALLDKPIIQYFHNDSKACTAHYWPDWFHNLLQLMNVPPKVYTLAFDEECMQRVETAKTTQYAWYRVLYGVGYRTPVDLTFKEL